MAGIVNFSHHDSVVERGAPQQPEMGQGALVLPQRFSVLEACFSLGLVEELLLLLLGLGFLLQGGEGAHTRARALLTSLSPPPQPRTPHQDS